MSDTREILRRLEDIAIELVKIKAAISVVEGRLFKIEMKISSIESALER